MICIYQCVITCSLPNWNILLKSNNFLLFRQAITFLSDFSFLNIHEKKKASDYSITIIEDGEKVIATSSRSNYTIVKSENWIQVMKFVLYSLVDDYTSMYENDQIITLHGGVVKGKDGLCAILGGTHSGKSTLLSYLICKGYEVYSDDYIFINVANHLVYKYPQKIRLRRLNVAGLNSVSVQDRLLNICNGKQEYLINTFLNNIDCKCETIKSFVFIKRLKNNFKIINLSKLDLFSSLLRNLKKTQDLEKWKSLVNIANEAEGKVVQYETLNNIDSIFPEMG